LDKIRDIKPIVEINDYSFYLFIGIVIFFLTILLYIFYFTYKKLQKPKYYFDLNDSKATAYKLIEIIRDKEGSKKYIDMLHQYTYKKEVPPLDKALFYEIIEKFDIKI